MGSVGDERDTSLDDLELHASVAIHGGQEALLGSPEFVGRVEDGETGESGELSDLREGSRGPGVIRDRGGEGRKEVCGMDRRA